MVGKIRRDGSCFDKYQHNRDLVNFINLFADPSTDLPFGWETKKDRNSKVGYYMFISVCDVIHGGRVH